MTPFGERIRRLRRERGVTQRQMAAALAVTPAYLSALEHGRRGKPSWAMTQKIIGYFNVIWDEAEELETLAMASDPRVVIDTAGLSPQATLLANRLATLMSELGEDDIGEILRRLEKASARTTEAPRARSVSR